ncbi:MAG: GGDEF domain-containing protein [Lachnospiraceae bacterium]|nr:GGDEF domain-containing protein [Lachnospiraceae bacterium]
MNRETIRKYIHAERPAAGVVPGYYTQAIRYSYVLMAVYFCCYMICAFFLKYPGNCIVALPWLLIFSLLVLLPEHILRPWNIICFSVLILGWVITFILCYGWDCGAQHFIIPLMVIVMFSVHAAPLHKLLFAAMLYGLRLFLFFYCLHFEPYFPLQSLGLGVFQMINTAFIFINVVVVCLVFSTNIQASETKLLLINQELKKQANTDTLTGLSNRRHMLETMEKQIAARPSEIFSVAMGDIDLFKEVNDTYGHNCGDAVLQQLSSLFQKRLEGKGAVCRWGGEEFFFFLPGMNLDEASVFIHDLNFAVGGLRIFYKNMGNYSAPV